MCPGVGQNKPPKWATSECQNQHSVKNGKRYRYYTSQAPIHHREAPPGLKRIPAEEIERVVLERAKALLGAAQELSKVLKKIGLTAPALQRTAVAAAQKLAQQSQKTRFAQALRECIERVILAEAEITIHLSRERLLKVLLGPDARGVPKRSTGSSELVLACPFERRHWSNELRLIVPSADGAKRTEPTPLLRAIARARQWYERIATGEIYCLEQLAKEHGCTTNYISRLLELGRLSPQLIEQAVANPRKADVPIRLIPAGVSLAWCEQRPLQNS